MKLSHRASPGTVFAGLLSLCRAKLKPWAASDWGRLALTRYKPAPSPGLTALHPLLDCSYLKLPRPLGHPLGW